MKLSIPKSGLAEAVSWAARAISRNPEPPVLGGMLLRAEEGTLTATGFDRSVTCRATSSAETGEPGTVIVAGKMFAEVVSGMPAGRNVDMETDGGVLRMRSGAASWNLRLPPGGAYPDVPVTPEACGTLDSAVFSAALARTVPPALSAVAGKDMPYLNSVRLEQDPDDPQKITMVSTDRYRVASAPLPWTPAGEADWGAVNVPARILEMWPKSGTAGQEVTVGLTVLGDGSVSMAGFSDGTRELTAPCDEGRYLNWRHILAGAARSEMRTADLDAGDMTAAVKRLQVLIPASAPVWVTLTDGECLLAGGSQHDTGNDAIAASWDGEPVRMSFNPRYLLDGLSAAGGTVRFSVAGPKAPVFLSRSPADEQDEETRAFRYLLMPLKKPGQEPPE